MIGNDIVDLQAAALESNWQRKGFLTKLFSGKEQEIIYAAKDPSQKVWLLWSMKEAAYKAHQRRFKLNRRYNPLNFSTNILATKPASASGIVRTGNYVYYTRSFIQPKFLHSIAISEKKTEYLSEILPASQDFKELFLTKIAAIKDRPREDFSIKKNEQNIPFLAHHGIAMDHPFSLSHHGKYAAYCIALMKY